jgi:hypothetical protein
MDPMNELEYADEDEFVHQMLMDDDDDEAIILLRYTRLRRQRAHAVNHRPCPRKQHLGHVLPTETFRTPPLQGPNLCPDAFHTAFRGANCIRLGPPFQMAFRTPRAF